MNGSQTFSALFQFLTGHIPYPWQAALFDNLIQGHPPELIYIPTGGGKSDIISVWLSAVLHQIQHTGTATIPRRLYFAIDRRVVVDQAEELAQDLLQKINAAPQLGKLLKSQTISENPLVVSVMRGQRVTEQEPLIADPSCFAMTLCTPDMLLSRLLFSSYSSSHRAHSREAGLVGQDAYLVLDEAHISDAARRTLEYVRQHNPLIKPWWATCMTATPRTDSARKLSLCEQDLDLMGQKLKARKWLRQVEQRGNITASVLSTVDSVEQPWQRMIVYIEKPSDALKVCEALAKDGHKTMLLTGTMRGLEKSRLNFDAFKPDGRATSDKHVLICTSAGEVGLNVSSEILISEFVFADRLAQRLGRLNRWGESTDSYSYVINTKPEEQKSEPDDKTLALKATLEYLKSLLCCDGWTDVSCLGLYKRPIPEEAFGPAPVSLVLNDAIVTQLANTSVQRDISPEPYIRGLNVEYHLDMVIRHQREVELLAQMDEESLENYVSSVPVFAHEIFREPVDKALIFNLTNLLGNRQTLFVSLSGEPSILSADDLVPWKLRGGTLYLPDDLKCIDERGMFRVGGNGTGDVFKEGQEKYRRFAVDEHGYMCLDTGALIEANGPKQLLRSLEVQPGFKIKIVFNEGGLVYTRLMEKVKPVEMTLSAHKEMAVNMATKLTAALNIPPELAHEVIFAMTHHDDGKSHWLWQLAARGSNDGEPLAKLKSFLNPKLLGGMRHELISALNADGRDLAAWLIASHHGRCRPLFPEQAYAPDRREECKALNGTLPYLFERFTKQHGHWALAYLEAIVRAIDIQSEQE